MRSLMISILLAAALPLAAATTSNDDSCDIGMYPAATLLLPHFMVDLVPTGTGQTTIFSITNVSPSPQIARVTIWTDWAFPVLSFNLFLTGYDVQPINLFDVIGRGLIGGTRGTSTGSPNGPNNPNRGSTPLGNLTNPNFLPSVATDCAPGRLPGQLPPAVSTDIRAILTTGRSTGHAISCPGQFGEEQVGFNHGGLAAIGYVTIDVVAACSAFMPADAGYWSEILYDNVLTGDYQQVDANALVGNYAGGNPMVHIRAIPEGGSAGSAMATSLPFTFYDRFNRSDRRQPLPSSFSARWISGSNAGFDTRYKIWREAFSGLNASCNSYVAQSAIPLAEIVRFDERENAAIPGPGIPEPGLTTLITPATASLPVTNSLFPYGTFGGGLPDPGGWMYFNLSNGGDSYTTQAFGPAEVPYSASRPGYGAQPNQRDVSQNWVTVSMFAEGRFGVESDATSLGNGCSPAAGPTSTAQIGPARNVNP